VGLNVKSLIRILTLFFSIIIITGFFVNIIHKRSDLANEKNRKPCLLGGHAANKRFGFAQNLP
jgi:hypothetical protein